MRANAGGIFLRYPFTPFRSCRGKGVSRKHARDFPSTWNRKSILPSEPGMRSLNEPKGKVELLRMRLQEIGAFVGETAEAGHYHDCLDACLQLIDTEKLRGDDLRRITANARWAREAIQKESPAKQLGRLGERSFLERRSLETPRPLRSRIDNPPRVLISILAKQKEAALPLYLKCIESLDYPKDRIVLYVRTNNNRDNTKNILESWVARVRSQYAGVEMDARDVTPAVEKYGVHEWNPTRFAVLAEIRNTSLKKTLEHNCDFYFVCDVDNFIRPCTLSELVALNLPIVAPFLRSADPRRFYSNFHAEIDGAGYYADCDQYYWIANQWVRGSSRRPWFTVPI